MFSTEKFIKEIRLRECIWNTQTKAYANKILRRNAWNEILEALNPNWAMTTTTEDRYKLKIDYIKKWKNIKDYYYRSQFKSGGPKKKKPSYFKILSFLDAIKQSKDRPRNVVREQKPDNSSQHPEETENREEPSVSFVNANKDDEEDDEEDDTTQTSTPEPKFRTRTSSRIMKQKQQAIKLALLKGRRRSRDQDEGEFNSNKHFLLSLLADMDKMDDEQNLHFRVSVLNIVKNIKNKDDSLEV